MRNSSIILLIDSTILPSQPAIMILHSLNRRPGVPVETTSACRVQKQWSTITKWYNRTLSAARSCIERAFALLKSRWRRLKYLDMSRVERIPYVIIAGCVLHNVCILNNDLFDIQSDDVEENVDIINCPSNDDDRNEGVRKRLDITRML